MKKIIFWGGTGQSKVMRPVAETNGYELVAVFDDTMNLTPPFTDIECFHGSHFQDWIEKRSNDLYFSITIGNPNGHIRKKLSDMLKMKGLKPATLIHLSAIIAANAIIGEGAQIHAGAIIGEEVIIGDQCIVNTRASIDHECILGTGVEIAPGSTLCGCVILQDFSTVFAGATVFPRVHIGKHAIVGAGSLVTKDIENNAISFGVPAKVIKIREGNFSE